MALSQCLDDSPGPRLFKRGDDAQIKEVYNERHRLALEELVAGGLDSYLGFLKKEKIPNFLSDDEIRRITSSTVVPRSVSLNGEDAGLECSVSSSMDCSSVTYFPNVSDVEPPLLEMGWPAFTAGSFRGITRAVAHFQPSYGECIYSCKEAVRRMIKSAKEVIAVVTDSLTDLDIFRDLQEACCRRRVPVYLLLDQSCVPSFLQMCANLGVRLDELRNMRVRSLTGATYFLRSGAKITGKVHERFMLVDGNRVATGSYRFNWTDGKLNSSNLIELSGQITENFDEEFRILYAQSLPINPRAPPIARGSSVCIPLLIKQPGAPQSPKVTAPEPARLSSTPKRAQDLALPLPSGVAGEKSHQDGPPSDTSTIEQDWMEQERVREVLALDADSNNPAALPTCQVATQTTMIVLDRAMQTDPETQPAPSPAKTAAEAGSHGGNVSSSSGSDSVPPLQTPVRVGVRLGAPPPIRRPPCDGNLRDCFRKLTKERQYHYSTIRSKLDHMVTLLSHRRELVDLTNLALSPGFRRVCKDPGRAANSAMLMDGALPSHWTRARCLQ